ncbi:MAG TPA: ADOP family duplicated permease [Vicinamibacterales bacterium]|nr:ADOP family duplicated permease [Vicinamibacterales bacterium]
METLWQDVRYAGRQLRGSVTFAAAAVLTLAVGIGTTTAIFSMISAALLRPLPYPDAGNLIDLHTRLVDGRLTTGLVSAVEISHLRDPGLSIAGVAGVSSQPFDATLVRDDGTPVHIVLAGVTEGFFDVLGLPMARGRAFNHEDHAVSGQNAPMTIVLSYRAWRTIFGADPQIVGKTLRIAEAPMATTVVGVAAPAVDLPAGTDFWFNFRIDPQSPGHIFMGLLRMRPGTSLARVRSQLTGVMASLAREVPSDAVAREYVATPLVTAMVGDLRPTLLVVFGATALLLLLACVNVSTLLLARGAARTREAAVRAALGASTGRIVRQLLTEALVLAAIGAAAAVGLAYAGVRLLLALGASKLPRLEAVPFDGRVLGFALGILVFSGLAMGVVPAWRLARADIRALVNESGRGAMAGRGTSRLMASMIAAEIALAIALVAGAGWLVQSFARLSAVDPGFSPAGRLVVTVRPTRRFSQPDEARAWSDEMLRRVATASGVDRAGAALTFPFGQDRDTTIGLEFKGEHSEQGRLRSARWRVVTDGFFEAMGIRLVSGRTLTADDRSNTAPVAVVNRAFVRQELAGRDPLGVEFAFGFPAVDPKTMRSIVGVVEDVRYASLATPPEPTFYVAQRQMPFPFVRGAVVVVPKAGRPEGVVPAVRDALKAFDPQMSAEFESAADVVASTLSRQQLGMTLLIIFGATALVLAAIGVYGVIAYAGTQRRGEIATRIALGATHGAVFRLMIVQGVRVAAAGTAIGLLGAYAGGRVAAANVYEMRASDPLVLASSAAIVGLLALGATAIPAFRAGRVDPVRALRGE